MTRGSEWQKWDLHIHAPGTKLSDGFDGGDEELDRYCEILERSGVSAFGITDYFSADSFFRVKSNFDRLFPEHQKLFIPNIEFRLTETVSSDGRNVHCHVLIDPSLPDLRTKIGRLLSDLETHITEGERHLRCADLQTKSHFESATVSIAKVKQALKAAFTDKNCYLILMAANNDGLRGVDTKSRRSLSLSDELDKASHAFFGSKSNSEWFLTSDRYEGNEESPPKPVFSGSDAHSMADMERLTGDVSGFPPTWIKSDLSFRGLLQTTYEPEARVFIGDRPAVLNRLDRTPTKFISTLQVSPVASYSQQNGRWFENVQLSFNPELTAIIGNKGSGKSAIADIVGLLAHSRQYRFFSFLSDGARNRKFKQKGYAENFIGTLEWWNGDKHTKKLNEDANTLEPEAAKYLPQNYFESLTNEIEVNDLRTEIENVVFSHVSESDRLGKTNFHDLEEHKTTQSKQDISALKAKVREINLEIVDLESKSSDAARSRVSAQLNKLISEIQALQASMPPEVSPPADATADQTGVAEKIDMLQQKLKKADDQFAVRSSQLSLLKIELGELSNLLEAVSTEKARVAQTRLQISERLQPFGIPIDQVIDVSISTKMIEEQISDRRTEIKQLETQTVSSGEVQFDLGQAVSLPDLELYKALISKEIQKLNEELSAPQRRYQKYLAQKHEIEGQISALRGDNDTGGITVSALQKELNFIDHEVGVKLEEAKHSRAQLAEQIFEIKNRVRAFYSELKAKVEESLRDINTKDFEATIDASLILNSNFSDMFFKHINQNIRGDFRGVSEGRIELDKMVSPIDFNEFEEVLAFVNEIIERLNKYELAKQVDDVKGLYDFLFCFDFVDVKYELMLGQKSLTQLSPGEKGLLLLVFYLHLDKEQTPLIIDQPEDNLDNDSIFSVLAKCIRQAKKRRQVILVTHNPNLAVGADAEQVINVHLDKSDNYRFTYASGPIENPEINSKIVQILEGSKPAFVQRRLKYQIH